MDGKPEKLCLKAEVGLMGGLSLIAGVMIGSGIFMSPQTVLINIGSPGASFLIWTCSGVLSMLAALSYIELGTMIQESGGEYIYILHTSGKLLAFLFVFSSISFVRPTSITGIALSFAQYAVAPFYEDCMPPDLVVKCVAAVGIVLLAVINCLNVRFAMTLNILLLAAKCIALVVISIGGVVMLIQGNTANFQNTFEGTDYSISVIGLAFYQCLWSYDGWNNLNSVTEELKRPETTVAADMDGKPEKLRLKAEVGLMGGLSLIAGVMIGSGIFMSPQTVLINVGSPGASFLIWTCSGVLSMLAALSYIELGTMIQESGGEYIYILHTSGKLLAFVFVFSSVLFVRPVSITGIALSFAQYAVAPFYEDCMPPDLVVKCVAAVGIVLLAVINCLNVRFAMTLNILLLAAKCIALVVISIGGVVMLIQGNTANFQNTFEGTDYSISVIGLAFYQCLWSYDGWNNLNFVTEELKRPEVITHMLK